MLTKKLSEDAKRPNASCYECERLNTCRLKAYILAKDVTCSNYAAEGCIRFKSKEEEKNLAKQAANKRIREWLLSHKTFKLSMCEEWGISRKVFRTNLFVLKQRGYVVEQQNVGEDIFYKINL